MQWTRRGRLGVAMPTPAAGFRDLYAGLGDRLRVTGVHGPGPGIGPGHSDVLWAGAKSPTGKEISGNNGILVFRFILIFYELLG